MFERAYGSDHCEVAVNLNNLAALHQTRGDAAKTERLYRRALSIRRKLLGRHHPDVAMTLNNLAVLLKSRHRFSHVEPLYKSALAIRGSGRRHPEAADPRPRRACVGGAIQVGGKARS